MFLSVQRAIRPARVLCRHYDGTVTNGPRWISCQRISRHSHTTSRSGPRCCSLHHEVAANKFPSLSPIFHTSEISGRWSRADYLPLLSSPSMLTNTLHPFPYARKFWFRMPAHHRVAGAGGRLWVSRRHEHNPGRLLVRVPACVLAFFPTRD